MQLLQIEDSKSLLERMQAIVCCKETFIISSKLRNSTSVTYQDITTRLINVPVNKV